MLEVYITKLEKGLVSVAPTVMDKENFLLIIGSLFLLGAVTKWIVWHHYGKLIRRQRTCSILKMQLSVRLKISMKVSGR